MRCLGSDFRELSFFFDSRRALFGCVVRFIIFQVFTYRRGYIKRDSISVYFFLPLRLFRGRIILLIFRGRIGRLFLA